MNGKTCKEDEILNPASGRCVKRNGKIGKSILIKNKDVVNPVAKDLHIAKTLLKKSCEKIKFDLDPKIYTDKFNCRELPLKDIKFIYGPCTFFHFKYGKRNIYLFGESHLSLTRSKIDTHMTNSNTIMFSSFIESLITQNINKTYDVMFESLYFIEKDDIVNYDPNNFGTILTKSTSPAITLLSRQFANCIRPISRKRFCSYKNLRLHYIDFRNSKIGLATKKTSTEKFRDLVNKMVNSGKVPKQINSIKNRSVVSSLKTFIDDKLNPANIHRSKERESLVMDIYTLGRLIRDFDKTVDKDNTAFRGTSENVIVYAGAIHINTMVEFFTDYLNLPILNSIPYKQNVCESYIKLDVSKIFL